MLVAVVKGQLVFDAAARLDDCRHALLVCNLHAVGEGEEGIAGHDSAVQVEAEVLGLLDGLLQRIHAAGLAHAAGQQLLALGQDDGVGLGVLHDFVGKEHILYFGLRGCLGGDRLQVGGRLHLQVAVLCQHAVQQRAELTFGQLHRLAHQDDAVLLLPQHLQGIHVIIRRDDHLEEDVVDFLGRLFVHHGIGDEHAAKGRYRVAGQRVLPRLEHRRARSQSAGVVVLQDGEGGFLEFVDQVDGRIDVQQVVVGDFLAVDLVEHLIQVAVEVALLVRILAVAQGRLVVGRATEGRSVLAVEVVEDGRVVVGRYAEGFLGKPAALLQRRRGATLHEDVAQRLVLRLRGHDDHVVVVLGCRADQRDAAYVDLLDDVCLGCAAGHGRLERIEVHDDQVYFGDVIFLDLLLVLLQGATAEDAAENLGMQRLDAPAQDGGIGRQVFHRRARIAQRFDELACASRRKEFHAFFVQFGNDLVQSFFVVYRYQRSLDSLCIGHNFYVYNKYA